MQFLIPTLYAFLISLFVTPLVIAFARRFKLMDDPATRKHPANTHKGVVPRGGGIGIFIAILLACVFFIPATKILIGILVGAFLIVLMGAWDDYADLSPYVRLFLSIFIVLIVISSGLGIPYISNPFGGVIHLDQWVFTFHILGVHKFYVISNLFAIVWVIMIMNFVDFSGGVDGQLPGFTAVAAFFLGLLAYRFTGHHISADSISLLAFIIAASFLGFLVWNFYPQKIMPGYGGKALAGFLIGVLSILSWGKVGTMILVLSIPFTDAIYVIGRRILQGKSPFRGDSGHFHHRLLQIGWGRRRIAVFYWIVSGLFGVAALEFQGLQKLLAIMTMFVFLAIFILILNQVKKTH
jgi:UDP-GlcNAc:undecaprenyl-phosphate GlcNAc-1-phosphate transferase